MSSQHTPGPWDSDADDFSVYQLETLDPITGPLHEIPNANTEANARLIAAAPELLDFLITLQREAYLTEPWRIDKLNALIDKAEGRTA